MAPPRPVLWSPAAVKDLTRIGRRVAADSAADADQLLDQIEMRVGVLGAYPEIGHVGNQTGTRELLVHAHYFVIYRVLPEGVQVLRIKHSARKRPT